MNDMDKLLPIMGCVDEMFFKREYRRIAQLMRLPIQASTIKALLNFQDPNYQCFTFENIDMTPTLKQYSRILDFSNDYLKVYFRQRFEDTTLEIIRLLYLGMVNQCRIVDEEFIWKSIEAKMKKDMEEKKLGNERYKIVAFAIFGLAYSHLKLESPVWKS